MCCPHSKCFYIASPSGLVLLHHSAGNGDAMATREGGVLGDRSMYAAAGPLTDPLVEIVPKAMYTEFRYIITVVRSRYRVREYVSRVTQGYAYRD